MISHIKISSINHMNSLQSGYDLRTWEDLLKGQQRDPILDIRKCLDKCHFDINKGKLIENVLINMAFDLAFPIAAGNNMTYL